MKTEAWIPDRTNLFGYSLLELETLFKKWDEPKFRAKQLFEWIYSKRTSDFSAMTNLSKPLRTKLEGSYHVTPPDSYERFVSTDGSVKYVFDVGGGNKIEAVYMPMTKGVTMCLSSQVGCAQDCSFCMTAKMGFIRNLSPGEIIGQAFTIMADQNLDRPFNVVMMGMGEPLLNVANLTRSLDVFTHKLGFNLSPKRITVSTSGHVRNLQKLGTYPRLPRIAVSLNASTDEQRDVLMPINIRWNIKELIDACRELPIPARDRITFEYVLIKGINDTPADAKRLVRLLANIRCKVNLIPFNETEGLDYQQPSEETIYTFQQILVRGAILNTVRWSKGRDIGAACGQLATPIKERGAHLRSRQRETKPA